MPRRNILQKNDVIARSVATKQSRPASTMHEIAALPSVARNDNFESMKQRFDPAMCGFLATAASVVNLVFLTIATYPVDPLDIKALARLEVGVVPWLVVSLVADLAFYLLLIPVAIGLGGRKTRWAGVGYALIGAAGAMILLWQWPVSLHLAEAERFERVTRVVYFGLWNGVGAALACIWWAAVGWHIRHAHRAFAVFTMGLALLALLDVVSFRLVSIDVAGWVLRVLLGGLMVWPAAAALGPLRRRAERPGVLAEEA